MTTDITELARRVEHIISDMKLKHGDKDTYAPVMKWDEFLALVEALEKAQQRIDSQREYYEGVIADGGKRIAELESRTVKLPDFRHERFNSDWGEHDAEAYQVALREALTAAGIKVEAE
ncbi:TPA: hypothetical protein NIJ47_002056 [Klebsiella pneumoniae]|uniref:hypothetical protein n=1 Tax=Klebsiella pneumoniae TaxID=573 RepID=UPI003310A556|nr:hypothetical protein [Klebsiella pneumoniae]HCK0401617.1 hypothetical protein [Klebsiella pneumoniae]HDH0276166.1 hypothetical protein [Klebsiella pneumoniae]HDH0329263.1 hypothetical protein [Klebsiella pneumoniae]HDH0818096.1 hypothetical protein [Klebsiella pneumoniae]